MISGNKAFIVYRIDADHAEWGTLNMSEVAIQEGRTERWCARNVSTDPLAIVDYQINK